MGCHVITGSSAREVPFSTLFFFSFSTGFEEHFLESHNADILIHAHILTPTNIHTKPYQHLRETDEPANSHMLKILPL
jgi:hypothetical protein